jgi:hypothetical protein
MSAMSCSRCTTRRLCPFFLQMRGERSLRTSILVVKSWPRERDRLLRIDGKLLFPFACRPRRNLVRW